MIGARLPIAAISQNPKLMEAARLLADGEPPAWFVTNLYHMASSLAACHIRDRNPVGRKAMRERLEKVAEAARLIICELHEVETFLERDGPLEFDRETIHTLKEIAARADKQARAIPLGGGRAPASALLGGAKTTTLCAALVVEAWTVLDRGVPGTENPQAHQAAEALWQATGGPDRARSNPEDGTGLGRWRAPFREVRKLSEQDRKRWRRNLAHGKPAAQNTPENSSIPSVAASSRLGAPSSPRLAGCDKSRRRKTNDP